MVPADHAVNVAAEDGSASKEGTQSAEGTARGHDRPPPREPVDVACDGARSRVTHDGRERRDKDEQKGQYPTTRESAPLLGDRIEPFEKGVRKDDGQDAQDSNNDGAESGEEPLQGRHAEVDLEGLLAEEVHRRPDASRKARAGSGDAAPPPPHERVREATSVRG